MKFSAEYLEEEALVIEDKIIGHSRWSVAHRRVIKHFEKYYVYVYNVGATEYQSGYQFDPDEMIECTEVIPISRTITVYIEVETEHDAG